MVLLLFSCLWCPVALSLLNQFVSWWAHFRSDSITRLFNGHFLGEPGFTGLQWSSFSVSSRRKSLRISGSGFLQAECPSCYPTNSVKALKETPTTALSQWPCLVLSSSTSGPLMVYLCQQSDAKSVSRKTSRNRWNRILCRTDTIYEMYPTNSETDEYKDMM